MTILLFCLISFAYQTQAANSIWDLPKLEERQIDFGYWALVIAKTADPSVDVDANLKLLDQWAEKVRRGLPADTDEAKMFLTHTVLYQAGFWNEQKPFTYDLKDPLGENPHNKLLSTYLQTRKGNCVSMPTLVMAVMERLDPNLNVYGSLAPNHMLCRFVDRQTHRDLYLETTQGTISIDDQYLRDRGNLSQKAIDSGIYLKKLSKKAFLGELISTLVQKARMEEDWDLMIRYADLMLRLSPNSVTAMVNKAAALHQKVYVRVEKAKEQGLEDLPESERAEALTWSEQGQALVDQAKALGWQPSDEAEKAAYLEWLQQQR